MSDSALIDALLGAGLIQFGAYDRDGVRESFLLRLDMMASYPAVLKRAAAEVVPLIDVSHINRLVCTHDAVAMATLVSQTLDIPLVIHSGALGDPQRNLVGAYDVGHPAALLSLSTDVKQWFVSRLTADAASVGLKLTRWVTLIETSPTADLPHDSPLHLADVASYLVGRGELSASMAAKLLR